MHAQSGNGWIDFNQIWHIASLGDIFEAAAKLVQGFGRGRGAKFRLSHWLYHWLLTLRIALPHTDTRDVCILFLFIFYFALTLLVGRQEGHLACKKMGGRWRWALVSLDGVAPSRMVGVSASVNLPLAHKVQKFASGTGSPGGPGKRAVKRLWWC